MKDPVWSKIVHIEVHTQLHSATLDVNGKYTGWACDASIML